MIASVLEWPDKMMIDRLGGIAAAIAIVASVIIIPAAFAAESESKAIVERIDLSPGADAHAPEWLAINRTTGRLFVGGSSGVKVIAVGSREAIAGIEFGRYANSSTDFQMVDMAVDESSSTFGNKLYILGRASETVTVVRIIDTAANESLTGEGSDIVLPPTRAGERYTDLVVNRVNQKVYVATTGGRVTVVDGPGRKVLRTLDAGASGSLVVNPAANRVFVLGGGRSSFIDSNTDTLSWAPLAVGVARSPVYNEQNGRIYFTGTVETRQGAFAIDGNTTQLLAETASEFLGEVAVAPEAQRVYVSRTSAKEIAVLDATSLSSIDVIPYEAHKMVYGSAGGPLVICHLHATADVLRNAIGLVDPVTKALDRITVAYWPVELAFNSAAQRLYAADSSAAELIAIDSAKGQVLDRIDVQPPRNFVQTGGGDKRDVAVSSRFNRVFLSKDFRDATGVDIFDSTTHQLLKFISVRSSRIPRVGVDDVAAQFYLTGDRAAGAGQREHLLYVFGADDALLGTIPLGTIGTFAPHAFEDLAVNPVTGRVYVFGAGGVLHIIDAHRRESVVAVDVGHVFGQLAIDTKTNTAYVARWDDSVPSGQNSQRVIAIDGDTGAIIRSIAIPALGTDAIAGIAIDEVSNTLYVSHSPLRAGGRVTVFDVAHDYRVKAQFHIPQAARLLYDAASRSLYTSAIDGSVTMVRPDAWKLLGNISTRASVGTGDQVLIGGFIVAGPEGSTKQVIVRAIGPSLSAAGVPGVLANPTLELHGTPGNVLRNDNWKIDEATNASQQAAIEGTGIPPQTDVESALVATLAPGLYTVIVSGTNGSSGTALVEVYDLEETGAARLANISTRGFVGRDDQAMIGGVIVLGLHPSQLLVRAIGPSLTSGGVANALEDPTLELYDSNGALLAANDDWRQNERAVEAAGAPPQDDRESALVASLPPATYTAVVRGRNGATGVALVEAYNLD